VAVQQAALVSDESALEACLRRCAIQIDDLYLFYLSLYVWVGYNSSVVMAWVLLLVGGVFCRTLSVLLDVASQLKFSAQFR